MMTPICPSAARAEVGLAGRQEHAIVHATLLIERRAELLLPQRARQLREQVRGRSLVVPHVRAASETAAALVVTTLKSMEPAVRGAEAGLRHQRGEIRHRGFLHHGGSVVSRTHAANSAFLL
jgi:hypothetical protein